LFVGRSLWAISSSDAMPVPPPTKTSVLFSNTGTPWPYGPRSRISAPACKRARCAVNMPTVRTTTLFSEDEKIAKGFSPIPGRQRKMNLPARSPSCASSGSLSRISL
jgi:hypothetical protein